MVTGKRQQWSAGSVVLIKIRDNLFGYGVLLEQPVIAFLKPLSEWPLSVDEIDDFNVWCKLAVHNLPISTGDWPKIGKIALKDIDSAEPFFFTQDRGRREFSLYHSSFAPPSYTQPAEYNEVIGLERLAVWEKSDILRKFEAFSRDEIDEWTIEMRPKKP